MMNGQCTLVSLLLVCSCVAFDRLSSINHVDSAKPNGPEQLFVAGIDTNRRKSRIILESNEDETILMNHFDDRMLQHSTVCEDVDSFLNDGGRVRTCPWVALRLENRCLKFSEFCPVTCDTCPSASPTTKPSAPPTEIPTTKPSPPPTAIPTTKPTSPPTAFPTTKPSPPPTAQTTMKPSLVHTASPTTKPSSRPTAQPTLSKTASPTMKPSSLATAQPTLSKTTSPTAKPSSTSQTEQPTSAPTDHPTIRPTHHPTMQPTHHPTEQPTFHPTEQPTSHPTEKPTFHLSAPPSQAPNSNIPNPTTLSPDPGLSPMPTVAIDLLAADFSSASASNPVFLTIANKVPENTVIQVNITKSSIDDNALLLNRESRRELIGNYDSCPLQQGTLVDFNGGLSKIISINMTMDIVICSAGGDVVGIAEAIFEKATSPVPTLSPTRFPRTQILPHYPGGNYQDQNDDSTKLLTILLTTAIAVAAVAAVGLAAFVLRHGKDKQDRPNPFATGPDDYIIPNEANTIDFKTSSNLYTDDTANPKEIPFAEMQPISTPVILSETMDIQTVSDLYSDGGTASRRPSANLNDFADSKVQPFSLSAIQTLTNIMLGEGPNTLSGREHATTSNLVEDHVSLAMDVQSVSDIYTDGGMTSHPNDTPFAEMQPIPVPAIQTLTDILYGQDQNNVSTQSTMQVPVLQRKSGENKVAEVGDRDHNR